MGFKFHYLYSTKRDLDHERSSKVIRTYGSCDKICVPFSIIYAIETLASHHVPLKFKHWNIYVYSICPLHGLQIWCIEKLFSNVTGLHDNLKTYENYCIFFSCSHYSHYICHHKLKYASKMVALSTVADYIMEFKDNGYHFIIDNCLTFKRRVWSRLSRLID